MRSLIFAILAIVINVFAPDYTFAKGGGKGGHYVGGQGSSHKGGHYVNSATGNHYSNYEGGSSAGTSTGSTGYSRSTLTYSSGTHYQFSRRSITRPGSASRSKPSPTYMRHYQSAPGLHGTVVRDSNGRISRSESAKLDFLKRHGIRLVPTGYHVDHIVPLYAGGCDCPSNMQLLTVQSHHAKTKADFERYGK